WDEQAKKFTPCGWLPTINAPVYLEKTADYQIEPESIGHFPGTNLHVRIKSVVDLVTHNTAILGILGVGKSCLAFEIVERLLSENIKVICLDLTDEYREKLQEFCYDFYGDEMYNELVGETGADGKKKVSKHVEEGGSKPPFSEKLDAYIERFINEGLGRNLLVFNPSQYEVWRQDSKPYANEASMASLSPTEITQLFTEAALKACQRLGRVNKGVARVCLVFEEAHSLVPEWNTAVNDGDKAAVNATARAILQGRKFGLGCLLITQRTANVTKTILNQCNTVFAMRTFDETGKEFLSNYIGRDYTDSLSSIQERHAVLFGKASSCENPILIRLNDTEVFRPVFRAIHPPPEQKPPKAAATANAKAAAFVAAGVGDEFDDDIPF
ncbi:MAG: ATP-binding protein, partial [Steroidobacteraceae bacterium]